MVLKDNQKSAEFDLRERLKFSRSRIINNGEKKIRYIHENTSCQQVFTKMIIIHTSIAMNHFPSNEILKNKNAIQKMI
jgi:hypothetical protein